MQESKNLKRLRIKNVIIEMQDLRGLAKKKVF